MMTFAIMITVFVILFAFNITSGRRLDTWDKMPEKTVQCFLDCERPDSCYQLEELFNYAYERTENCTECLHENKCSDVHSPFFHDCVLHSHSKCLDTCDLTIEAALRLQTCHNCRRNCMEPDLEILLEVTSNCLEGCKSKYSCAPEPDAICNHKILERCHGRGPACYIHARCKIPECPPVDDWRSMMKCKRCYRECGTGITGGPGTYFVSEGLKFINETTAMYIDEEY